MPAKVKTVSISMGRMENGMTPLVTVDGTIFVKSIKIWITKQSLMVIKIGHRQVAVKRAGCFMLKARFQPQEFTIATLLLKPQKLPCFNEIHDKYFFDMP